MKGRPSGLGGRRSFDDDDGVLENMDRNNMMEATHSRNKANLRPVYPAIEVHKMNNVQSYLFIFLIWLISVALFRAIFTIRNRTKLRLPPSPLALPIIGHLHLFRPTPYEALQKLTDRYGPLIQIYLGSIPFVVVGSAEIAKQVLKTNDVSFSNRPLNTAITYLTYNVADFAFAPYGTYWKFMKKLCMSELLNGRMLELLLPIRQEEINKFLQMMLKKGEVGEAVDVGAELLKLASSIIMRMAISKSCFNPEDDAHEVRKRVKESAKLSRKFNLSDYFWFCRKLDLQGFGKKLKEARDSFDTMIEEVIQEHEEERKKLKTKVAAKDILDVLLSISEDESSEVKITRDNIKAFLKDIFEGGTDTTAMTIEWALKELTNNPRVMEKARKEIDSVIGKGRVVNESDITILPYLQAVVKETLRLHPAGPLMVRESSGNCSIGGYYIPAKTRMFINVWALGRDPKYWDNPLEFQPERFVMSDEGKSGKNDKKREIDVRGQDYHLLPFGSGRRGCPAVSLALNVVQTSVAAMIQCFEWKQNPAVTIATTTNPLICIPKPRLTPFPSFPSSP
ncbi:cytochrome P450 93A3-like [Senna tora]|uniref:Cytochrome P450 93A3-like n=1 Tax=Senna tora TaxID=362788 RepID=A0A834TD00_9FABA|nr:cytochrome P450 93A3-like [Senna tora]